METASEGWARPGGDPAFAAVLTMRATPGDVPGAVLDFLEPGWGVEPLSSPSADQRRLLVRVDDEASLRRLLQLAGRRRGQVLGCADRLWAMSVGGRIQVRPRTPVSTAEDVVLVHGSGVARLAARIAAEPAVADVVTGRLNRVAVVSDGTAVLGLGDVGPLAALSVMEAKSALFAQLAGIDAVPVCLSATSAEELATVVLALAPMFGGINLDGVAAPRCIEVRRRLQDQLDIPVLHDPEHATVVVVLAALRNALRVVGKQLRGARIAVLGAGVVGTALTRLLLRSGAGDVLVWTPGGVLCAAAGGPLPAHEVWLAEHTNPRRVRGGLEQALHGADAVLGLSRSAALSRELLAAMAPGPIVFTLAESQSKIRQPHLAGLAAVLATRRPNAANQLTDAVVLPGLLRGAINARAPRISTAMLLAAADVVAGLVGEDRLSATVCCRTCWTLGSCRRWRRRSPRWRRPGADPGRTRTEGRFRMVQPMARRRCDESAAVPARGRVVHDAGASGPDSGAGAAR
ncbi:NAD(P)-dependent malic enzyme [Dactylosporangium sp. CS-047395]|uniref:NAD(P)-dependent malic enzyme n=1 Tax=Dactylosporangium sp. CS-047395 TaxID=3239936 RepID=UPI003D920224